MRRKSIAKGKNKGIKYEEKINNILKEKNLQLNSTSSAGASDAPDGYIWYESNRYPIEIKRQAADFAQVELRWDETSRFIFSKDSKNPEFVIFLTDNANFLETINNTWVEIPRKFTRNNLTEKDRHWDLDHFTDIKRSIDVSYIELFYNAKQPPVHYIQIQDRGFFYLGQDIAGLGVPRINGNPYLRARVKTRSASDNKWGFLVAIKMPGIKPSKFDLEQCKNRKFPISLGDHIKGPIEKFM